MNKIVFESLLTTNTSSVGQFALYAGGTALVLVCVMSLQVVWLRIGLLWKQKRKTITQLIWREFIGRRLVGDNPDMPKIRARDIYFILEEYDYMFGVIKGANLESLRKSFCELDLPVTLHGLLHSRDTRKKLYALITLGNLRDKTAWGSIRSCLDQEQLVISLSAARALVLIDPARAVNEIIPILLQRKDWPWANVAHILKLAGPKLVCKTLFDLIQGVEEQQQASLLRMYNILRCEEEYPVTAKILAKTTEDKVASVCLNTSHDPNIIHLAREYVHHKRWHVRMNAAVAIGRFGDKSDIPLLVELLKDTEWWVRYRAAQAIIVMPFIDKAFVQSLRANLNDPYADDIFVQVLNEATYS